MFIMKVHSNIMSRSNTRNTRNKMGTKILIFQ